MQSSRRWQTPAILAAIALLGGCSLFPWQSSRYGGESSEVFFLDLGRSDPRTFSYTLRLDGSTADVYFAFVNYGNADSDAPSFDLISSAGTAGAEEAAVIARSSLPTQAERAGMIAPALDSIITRRTEPAAVSDFNNNPPLPGSGAAGGISAGTGPPANGAQTTTVTSSDLASRAVIGTENITAAAFSQYSGDFSPSLAVQTNATLRAIADDGAGHYLRIWVEDALWSDTYDANATELVNEPKVDALAAEFLQAGADNDIRDWVTTMLGEPWGQQDYDNLLSESDYNNTIDILLVDILRDGQTSSGVVGYFFGKDNYYRTSGTGDFTDDSNERIMFYLDAPMFAQRTSSNTWALTDPWPQLTVSTLAHEFQHMIHFYQKNILRSPLMETQTWLNEMASMITEDLVSFRMGVPGPRGVDPVDNPAGTAGLPGNQTGWLPTFNANNDISLFEWDSSDPGPNYAINYGFGAFLARNFGGARFARELVQNPYVDSAAIDEALDRLGYREDFRDTLSQWAAAVLVSDEVIVPWDGGDLDGVYNAGEWFLSTTGSITYQLGSINLYNYDFTSGSTTTSGPTIYAYDSAGTTSRPPASVLYLQAASGVTGTLEWEITLGATTDLVVVAKAAQ